MCGEKGMSALPPEADLCDALAHVRFGPIADIQEFGCRQKRNPGHCPGLRCLSGSRVGVLVEAIIYPKLSYRNPLADFHAWDLDWHTAKCPDQCHRACTKIVVVEFGFHRPVIPKRPLNAAT